MMKILWAKMINAKAGGLNVRELDDAYDGETVLRDQYKDI